MTPGERIKYHSDLWPAACLANEWEKQDKEKRHEICLKVMAEVGGPLVTSSDPDFRRDEVTALFCYLEHIADYGDFDKSARWDTCRQDYKTYSRARQADWHEKQLYGEGRNKLDRNRFKGEATAAGGPLDSLDAESVRKRHLTVVSRHRKAGYRSDKKKEAIVAPARVPAPAPEPAREVEEAPF